MKFENVFLKTTKWNLKTDCLPFWMIQFPTAFLPIPIQHSLFLLLYTTHAPYEELTNPNEWNKHKTKNIYIILLSIANHIHIQKCVINIGKDLLIPKNVVLIYMRTIHDQKVRLTQKQVNYVYDA